MSTYFWTIRIVSKNIRFICFLEVYSRGTEKCLHVYLDKSTVINVFPAFPLSHLFRATAIQRELVEKNTQPRQATKTIDQDNNSVNINSIFIIFTKKLYYFVAIISLWYLCQVHIIKIYFKRHTYSDTAHRL